MELESPCSTLWRDANLYIARSVPSDLAFLTPSPDLQVGWEAPQNLVVER